MQLGYNSPSKIGGMEMENILYQLFSGDYDITPKRDKKQQELYDQIFAEVDKIKAALGPAFLDRLCDLEGERAARQNYQYYRSGFALGVCLRLEALGNQPSI